MPCLPAQERVERDVVPDKIAVLLSRRVEPGMKIGRTSRRSHDPDIGRQMGVDGQGKLGGRHLEFFPGQFEMSRHADGVDPRVGAAGTMDAQGQGEQFLECLLNFLLHTQAGFLDLPARVVRAFIGNDQFEFERVQDGPELRGGWPGLRLTI